MKTFWYSVLVIPSSMSTLSATNTHFIREKSRPALPLSLHTSKRVCVWLWGIEMVNASGFDDPLPCEPSQSSACARLASLHHLICLCGREGEELWNSCCSSVALSLSHAEFPLLSDAFENKVASLGCIICSSWQDRYRIGSDSPNPAEPDGGVTQQNMSSIKRRSERQWHALSGI